jgi:hypothetical protein
MSVDAAFFGFDCQEGRVDLEIKHALSGFGDLLVDGLELLAKLGVEIRGG